MLKRVIIFDFGGVLMKTVDRSPRYAWDARLNLPQGSVEHIVHSCESWHKAQTGLLTPAAYWADVAAQLHISPAEVRQLEQDFFSGDVLDAALIDYIRQLRQAGHTVGLLSNDSVALVDKLRRLGIADLFDPLVISAQIGVMKPSPAAYQVLLAKLARPAQAVIFVDDMPANCTGAAALGIHAIRYTPDRDLAAELAPLLTVSE